MKRSRAFRRALGLGAVLFGGRGVVKSMQKRLEIEPRSQKIVKILAKTISNAKQIEKANMNISFVEGRSAQSRFPNALGRAGPDRRVAIIFLSSGS